MNEERSRPSALWYLVAAGLLLAGAGAGTAHLVSGLQDLPGRLRQVVVPGETDLELPEAGTYTIYHEHRSAVGGGVYSSGPSLGGLHVEVHEKATGRAVALNAPSGSETYSIGGRAGYAVFKFEVMRPGMYTLWAGYAPRTAAVVPPNAPKTVLAVGQGFVWKLLGTIFGTLAFTFGGVALAVIIFVLTYVRRSRAGEAKQGALPHASGR